MCLWQPKIENLLVMTDNEILSAIAEASQKTLPGTEWAKRIMNRGHYRILYERDPNHVRQNPAAAYQIFKKVCEKFGKKNIRFDYYFEEGSVSDFPVLAQNSQIVPSTLRSVVIPNLPPVAVEYVFVAPELLIETNQWLEENLDT